MAAPWIDDIVQQLTSLYTEVALEAERTAQRQARLSRAAPRVWREMAECLRTFFHAVQTGLQGERIATSFRFDVDARHQTITFGKEAFPAVAFSARPDFASGEVTMTLQRAAPPDAMSLGEMTIPCRFELEQDGTVILRLNGHTCLGPEAAARWIIERAFTVEASGRVAAGRGGGGPMDPQEYEEIMRQLVRMAAHQDTINTDLRESIQELRAFNRQQIAINQDVQTTLARLETLLARMLPPADNGREA